VFVRGMKGLGDNIYQRAFVRQACLRETVFLETPWPELYADLRDVKPVRAHTTLRTQAKNQSRWSGWHNVPPGARAVTVGYGSVDLAAGSILDAMGRALPLRGGPLVMDLPDMGPSPVSGRYVVVRPVTLRTEWRNEARSPAPHYVAQAARWAREAGFTVVLVADIEPPHEVFVGAPPPHDVAFLRGELPVRQLMALCRDAAAIIGGVGWIVPAAIALQTPAFVLLGGQGGHNAPAKITDPRMNLERIGWAEPDRFCNCTRLSACAA
jgi:hypothetical protein